MKSQNDQILAHLKRGGAISPVLALNKYGCFRLAARINDLRNQGYQIETEIVPVNGKRVAVYYMGAK